MLSIAIASEGFLSAKIVRAPITAGATHGGAGELPSGRFLPSGRSVSINRLFYNYIIAHPAKKINSSRKKSRSVREKFKLSSRNAAADRRRGGRRPASPPSPRPWRAKWEQSQSPCPPRVGSPVTAGRRGHRYPLRNGQRKEHGSTPLRPGTVAPAAAFRPPPRGSNTPVL